MFKSNFIILSALAVSTASASSLEKKHSSPNILMVVCEDISPYLGCYGDRVAHTPNLDRFALQGIKHDNMFTSVGVSAPSRYSLITGRYSSEDGANFMRVNFFDKDVNVIPPAGVKCYTEYLRQAGYYCTNNAKTDYQFATPLSAWDEQGNKAHWKNAAEGQPFFSIVNLNVTHESYIWKNTEKPLLVSPDSIVVPPYFPDNAIVRHDMAVMYSNIQKMDAQFQALLNELEKSGKADNTIVIFYSDNGGPLPRGKREILDSGTRVPFMIRFPDSNNASLVDSNLNMFVDIPATVLSLAGIKPPSYMHGQAMYGKYKTKSPRKFVFGATDRFDEQVEKRASIRDNRYLYVKNYMPEKSNYKPNEFRLQMPMMQNMVQLYEDKSLDEVQSQWFMSPAFEEELYDCQNDPHQINNLAYNKKYNNLLEKMRKSFDKEWIQKYNPFWVKSEEQDFINKAWIEGKQPKTELPIYKIEDNRLILMNDLKNISISYQINGQGDKKGHWFLYKEGGVLLNSNDTITIIANRIGYLPSDLVTIKNI